MTFRAREIEMRLTRRNPAWSFGDAISLISRTSVDACESEFAPSQTRRAAASPDITADLVDRNFYPLATVQIMPRRDCLSGRRFTLAYLAGIRMSSRRTREPRPRARYQIRAYLLRAWCRNRKTSLPFVKMKSAK